MSVDHRTDLYATLGVDPGASSEEIKRSYRSLAKKYHPDSTGGCKKKEAKFKEISTAYDVLGDQKKRSEYDSYRVAAKAGFGGENFANGPGGFDISSLFSQMFGGSGPGSRGGHGSQRDGFRGGMFNEEFFAPGAGPGAGRRVRRKGANPAEGVAEEQTVRAPDGTPLKLRGSDTYGDLRVGLDEAILGTVKEVATLQGTAKIRVPSGTSSGTKLRLKGRGKTAVGGQAGNHYATIHIDVPKDLDEEAKEHLIRFINRTRTKR